MPEQAIIITLPAINGMQYGITVLVYFIIVIAIIWVWTKLPFT